jgi:hypothetical protein
MNSGFDQIIANVESWKPILRQNQPVLFVLLPILLGYTKNIIAFGFAAIGAGVIANLISNRLK